MKKNEFPYGNEIEALQSYYNTLKGKLNLLRTNKDALLKNSKEVIVEEFENTLKDLELGFKDIMRSKLVSAEKKTK